MAEVSCFSRICKSNRIFMKKKSMYESRKRLVVDNDNEMFVIQKKAI